MMASDRLSSRFPVHQAMAAHRELVLTVLLMLGLGLNCAQPLPMRPSSARFLTPKDLARPLLLDQNGQQLQLPSSHHSTRCFRKDRRPLTSRSLYRAANTCRPEPLQSSQGRGDRRWTP